jgi:hypothetical protein
MANLSIAFEARGRTIRVPVAASFDSAQTHAAGPAPADETLDGYRESGWSGDE